MAEDIDSLNLAVLEKLMAEPQPSAFLHDVVQQMWAIDPGFQKASALWQKGKYIGVESILTIGREQLPMAFTLSVESGNKGLLKNLLERLETGQLEFHRALNLGNSMPFKSAWLAQMGMGTLLVGVRPAVGIAIYAAETNAMSIPSIPDNGIRTLPVEELSQGWRLVPQEGSLNIIGAFPAMTPKALRAVQRETIRLSLQRYSDGLCFVGMWVKGWNQDTVDLPFSMALEKPENRRLTPPNLDGSLNMSLVLADLQTKGIVMVRPLRVPKKWASHLLDLIDVQVDTAAGYGPERQRQDIEAAYKRWPTPEEVFARGAEVCFCKPL